VEDQAGPAQPSLLGRLQLVLESPVVRFLAAAVLLVLVARAVDSSAVRDAAASARWILVLPAVLLVPVQYLGAALLWRGLARTIDPELSLAESFRAVMGSLSVSIWTPGRAGDFAARPTLMPRGSRRALAVAVGTESLLRLPLPLLLGIPAAFVVGFFGHVAFAGVLGVTAGATVLLLLSPGLSDWLAKRLRIQKHSAFLAGLSPSRRWALMVGHGGRFVILTAQFSLIAQAMSGTVEVPAITVAAAAVVIFAAKLLAPILNFAELGIREGASIVAFGAIGFSVEAALQASLLLYGVNVLFPAGLGAVFWLRRRQAG
jgi:uncharacterized membrane protein YbhN (UPF0104 family)